MSSNPQRSRHSDINYCVASAAGTAATRAGVRLDSYLCHRHSLRESELRAHRPIFLEQLVVAPDMQERTQLFVCASDGRAARVCV